MIEDKLDKKFINIVNEIKNEIKTTQIKVAVEANKSLINLYFKIGKILDENSKYGNSFIKNISHAIKMEYPNMKGFSDRNLRRMKLFYNEYKEDEKWPQLVANLPWGHNVLLMEKIKDKKIREIYIKGIIANGWSRNMLDLQIKSNYHLRIGNSFNNFKKSLPDVDSDLANNTIKDPYIFDFLTLKENYKEKELEQAMIERIKDVLMELGKGFSFVGNQYKISTENNDYFIDLLFYHLDLRCYIVIELKTTEFKPEYIGQLGFYVTAVNETLKKETDNQTIGLLLCKNKDRLTAKWSLKSTNVPIGISSIELNRYFPKEVLEKLPTEEDLNMYIDLENN